ncbi:hypothetical protein HELRODRAFT_138688, partial [Helobdella robusta]|uniref:MICOS complex subunit MIC10 n=1 Tax=Helobdella robusta TaxID=6412 RepID=T1EIW5_HELRO
SEDIYGEKWDRCLSESAIKIGRPWPVVFGSGIGIGIGYANCQHDFIHPNLVHGR